MNKAASGNECHSLEVEQLLAKHVVIATQPVAGKRQIAGNAVFIFKLVSGSTQCPTTLGVCGLIIQAGAIVVIDIVKLKILVDRRR